MVSEQIPNFFCILFFSLLSGFKTQKLIATVLVCSSELLFIGVTAHHHLFIGENPEIYRSIQKPRNPSEKSIKNPQIHKTQFFPENQFFPEKKDTNLEIPSIHTHSYPFISQISTTGLAAHSYRNFFFPQQTQKSSNFPEKPKVSREKKRKTQISRRHPSTLSNQRNPFEKNLKRNPSRTNKTNEKTHFWYQSIPTNPEKPSNNPSNNPENPHSKQWTDIFLGRCKAMFKPFWTPLCRRLMKSEKV